MYLCPDCQQDSMYFNGRDCKMECTQCGHKESIESQRKFCICGEIYDEYTPMYPSGCSKCSRSFVD